VYDQHVHAAQSHAHTAVMMCADVTLTFIDVEHPQHATVGLLDRTPRTCNRVSSPSRRHRRLQHPQRDRSDINAYLSTVHTVTVHTARAHGCNFGHPCSGRHVPTARVQRLCEQAPVNSTVSGITPVFTGHEHGYSVYRVLTRLSPVYSIASITTSHQGSSSHLAVYNGLAAVNLHVAQPIRKHRPILWQCR